MAGSSGRMRAPNRPLSHGLLRLWPAVDSKELLTSDFECCFLLFSKDLLISDFEQCFRKLGGKWVQTGSKGSKQGQKADKNVLKQGKKAYKHGPKGSKQNRNP